MMRPIVVALCVMMATWVQSKRIDYCQDTTHITQDDCHWRSKCLTLQRGFRSGRGVTETVRMCVHESYVHRPILGKCGSDDGQCPPGKECAMPVVSPRNTYHRGIWHVCVDPKCGVKHGVCPVGNECRKKACARTYGAICHECVAKKPTECRYHLGVCPPGKECTRNVCTGGVGASCNRYKCLGACGVSHGSCPIGKECRSKRCHDGEICHECVPIPFVRCGVSNGMSHNGSCPPGYNCVVSSKLCGWRGAICHECKPHLEPLDNLECQSHNECPNGEGCVERHSEDGRGKSSKCSSCDTDHDCLPSEVCQSSAKLCHVKNNAGIGDGPVTLQARIKKCGEMRWCLHNWRSYGLRKWGK